MDVSYNPEEGDWIDKQLAEIFNNNPSEDERVARHKLLFVREAKGVYSYCRKKVTF